MIKNVDYTQDQNEEELEEDSFTAKEQIGGTENYLELNDDEYKKQDTLTEERSEEYQEIIDNQNKAHEEVLNFEHKNTKISSLFYENKILITAIIIASIMVGALMGTLIIPKEDNSNLEQRYNALYEYYTEIQDKNQNLTMMLEQSATQVENMNNELYAQNQTISKLYGDLDKLFSENMTYVYPSESQLRDWLNKDKTDDKILNDNYSVLQQAIELSLKAKLQDWKLGVITIHWDEGNTSTKYTYNYIKLNSDIIAYIDPQNDNIWWVSNYELVTAGKTWDINGYSAVYVTEVDIIIPL